MVIDVMSCIEVAFLCGERAFGLKIGVLGREGLHSEIDDDADDGTDVKYGFVSHVSI
jgi:hypothetical protein